MFRHVRLVVGGVLILVVTVAAAIGLSYLARSRSGSENTQAGLWTCSMHPQVRMNHPDDCPICGMDLTPIGSETTEQHDASGPDDPHLVLSDHARKMARVETAAVAFRPLEKQIRTVGRIELDETTIGRITARIDGRVDEVFASFPGTLVKKGEHLVSIYSPDLLSTQTELLNAYRQNDRGGLSGTLVSSASRRLELWGITKEQIDELIKTDKAQTHVILYAPFGGTVVQKNVRQGQYVKTGEDLFTIADLSHVWLVIDIYEADLAWVRFGQTVDVTLESRPSEVVKGTVGFVEPLLNEQTRTVRVRAVLKNPDNLFKPAMYAQAALRVPIMSDGKPGRTGMEGKYACPMHPYVISHAPGRCRVCGMDLEKVPGAAVHDTDANKGVLSVPASAVLSTGIRQLVYVERKPGEYYLVEPKLGPRAGDYYPVVDGLKDGQRVVTRGSFLLD